MHFTDIFEIYIIFLCIFSLFLMKICRQLAKNLQSIFQFLYIFSRFWKYFENNFFRWITSISEKSYNYQPNDTCHTFLGWFGGGISGSSSFSFLRYIYYDFPTARNLPTQRQSIQKSFCMHALCSSSSSVRCPISKIHFYDIRILIRILLF